MIQWACRGEIVQYDLQCYQRHDTKEHRKDISSCHLILIRRLDQSRCHRPHQLQEQRGLLPTRLQY